MRLPAKVNTASQHLFGCFFGRVGRREHQAHESSFGHTGGEFVAKLPNGLGLSLCHFLHVRLVWTALCRKATIPSSVPSVEPAVLRKSPKPAWQHLSRGSPKSSFRGPLNPTLSP